VQACERDPFLFQLPGESEAVAAKRSEQIGSDYRVQEHFERENQDFETAKLIYLARVVSRSAPGPRGVGPSTVVHPIAAFRGTLPSNNQTLQDMGATGMCTDIGDGKGAWGAVGDLIVVFEGLPEGLKNAYGFNARPHGKDSFDVSSIRTVDLLDWLRDQGKDLDR
jgi:hypothetical protein